MIRNIRPDRLNNPKNLEETRAFKNIKQVMKDVDTATDILIRADNKDGVDTRKEEGIVSFPFEKRYKDEKIGWHLGNGSMIYNTETKKANELFLEIGIDDDNNDDAIVKYDSKTIFGREKTVMRSGFGVVTIDNKSGNISYKAPGEKNFGDFLYSIFDAMMTHEPFI